MRIVFLGTPGFALPTLRLLAERFDLVGVVTQPDRPAGRGRKPRPSPVRRETEALGLPVHPTASSASAQTMAQIRAWSPDVIVVAAFGQILRPDLLELPPHGCLNLHASLLPRWRGASPVQQAILHADPKTGVTVMKMDAGLDTGPILAQVEVPIRPDHTGDDLTALLATTGAALIGDTLPRWVAGELRARPQEEALATNARQLRREDGLLDPSRPAAELARRVRAFNSWPGTHLQLEDRRLAVLEADALPAVQGAAGRTGRIESRDGAPAVVTPQGLLRLIRVQAPGGKPMDAEAYLRGHPELVGALATSLAS